MKILPSIELSISNNYPITFQIMQLQVLLNNKKDRSYSIIFTDSTFSEIKNYIKENDIKKVLILTEDTVWKFHWENLFKELITIEDVNMHKYVFKAWEENKNINTALDVISYLNNIHFNRNNLIICFWWGVTWDLGGFVSSIYKRGVQCIQIPTTLLSMLDSSVWWKTGVDYAGIKNSIWTFNQPKLVIINSNYLQTLPEIQLVSGYFEWLKHSLLDNEEHFLLFLSLFTQIIENKEISYETLFNNIHIKADVVMRDEEEKSERKKLNYGHTFGHAIEELSQYMLPHGICVWYGIIFANILSCSLWYLDKESMNKINLAIRDLLSWYTLNIFSFDQILELMHNDKKNSSEKVNFVLMQSIWDMTFIDINTKDLQEAYIIFTYFIQNA